jgi:hypothetical protein
MQTEGGEGCLVRRPESNLSAAGVGLLLNPAKRALGPMTSWSMLDVRKGLFRGDVFFLALGRVYRVQEMKPTPRDERGVAASRFGSD